MIKRHLKKDYQQVILDIFASLSLLIHAISFDDRYIFVIVCTKFVIIQDSRYLPKFKSFINHVGKI